MNTCFSNAFNDFDGFGHGASAHREGVWRTISLGRFHLSSAPWCASTNYLQFRSLFELLVNYFWR